MSTSSAELRRIALRYAQALFDLATAGKQLDAVKQDLDAVAMAYAQSADFRRLLESPALSHELREKGVSAILTAAKASSLTREFFRVLAENRRTAITPFVVEIFAGLLAESRNEAVAKVTSAYPLKPAQIKELRESLKKATGRSAVQVETSENPAILGGVIVHVDGKMFDNSIASKINRLASEMKAQVQA